MNLAVQQPWKQSNEVKTKGEGHIKSKTWIQREVWCQKNRGRDSKFKTRFQFLGEEMDRLWYSTQKRDQMLLSLSLSLLIIPLAKKQSKKEIKMRGRWTVHCGMSLCLLGFDLINRKWAVFTVRLL